MQNTSSVYEEFNPVNELEIESRTGMLSIHLRLILINTTSIIVSLPPAFAFFAGLEQGYPDNKGRK
jgi:hypothetical protein